MKDYKSIIIVLLFIIALVVIAVWPSDKNKDMGNQPTGGSYTTASGLQIEVVQEGVGVAIENGQTAVVHYTGTFTDGKKFDSSVDRGAPFDFPLGGGQVIKGWDEGVLGMKVGEKRKLTVPPELGYGPNDYGPIQGGSTLLFDVELIGIK